MDEVSQWEEYSPVTRLRRYLEGRGIWDKGKEEELMRNLVTEIKRAISRARGELKPHPDEIFRDVYDHLSPRLEKQRQEMWEHLRKYREHYPNLKNHKTGNSM